MSHNLWQSPQPQRTAFQRMAQDGETRFQEYPSRHVICRRAFAPGEAAGHDHYRLHGTHGASAAPSAPSPGSGGGYAVKLTPEQIAADTRSGHVTRQFRERVELLADSIEPHVGVSGRIEVRGIVGGKFVGYDFELDRCRAILAASDATRIAAAIRYAYASVKHYEQEQEAGRPVSIAPELEEEFSTLLRLVNRGD